MEPLIAVRDLHKRFKDHNAIETLTFEVARGEIVGLLGPNGAGKTTAISILLGLVTATSGTVKMLGQDLARHRVEILRRCNFTSSYINLPGNLKVVENLLFFAGLYGVHKPKPKIDELLETFDITALKNRTTGALSAGESTRVNLCKALLNDPELLLLDEPTASLDPDMADKVRKHLRRIQKENGIGMLYTSHNMRDVEEICDRVLFMQKGKIIAEGTPDEVVSKFKESSLEDVFIRVARSGKLLNPDEVEPE